MSQSEAVYQPTTVTYETNSPPEQWTDHPISYLASTVSQGRRPCGLDCLPGRTFVLPALVATCVAFFIVGLILVVNGGLGYGVRKEDEYYMICIIVGSVFLMMTLVGLIVLFLRFSKRLCWRNAKDHLDTATGQALTVNPSTDLLVTAQYAPVSEVVYQPPAANEDTEQSKLMPQENKELSNEDTDRMVERDPRIVLRPLNTPAHEET